MWKFAKTDDPSEFGVSNMAFEAFNDEGSILREIVQNSLDAKRDDCDYVIVEIEINKRLTKNIPGYSDLKSTIDACYHKFEHAKKDSDLFKNIKILLSDQYHYLVTFRDLNTTGLQGGLDKNNQDSNMYQLIYVDGSTNKMSTKNSAGSFGVGKNAPFTKAGLRTLFYESYNIENNSIAVGKSILVSHDVNEEKRVPRGYYYNEDRILDYINQAKLKEYGTAIHIPFYKFDNKEEDIEKMIIDILENFMVAIDKGKLVVKFIDNVFDNGTIVIDKDSYQGELIDIKPKKDLKKHTQLKAMCSLLKSDKTIHEIIDLDDNNSAEIYLLTKRDSLDTKTQFSMREQLMLIQGTKIKGSLSSYDAIVIYHGATLNEALRKSEPAEHNKWRTSEVSKVQAKLMRSSFKQVEEFIESYFELESDDKITLKEFNNTLLDTNKETQDYFNIRNLDERQTLKRLSNSKTGNIVPGYFNNGNNKILNKDNKKIKTSLGLGDGEVYARNVKNITQKVRTIGDDRYKIMTLFDLEGVDVNALKLYCVSDNGKELALENCSFELNGNREVVAFVDKNNLDVYLTMEE